MQNYYLQKKTLKIKKNYIYLIIIIFNNLIGKFLNYFLFYQNF